MPENARHLLREAVPKKHSKMPFCGVYNCLLLFVTDSNINHQWFFSWFPPFSAVFSPLKSTTQIFRSHESVVLGEATPTPTDVAWLNGTASIASIRVLGQKRQMRLEVMSPVGIRMQRKIWKETNFSKMKVVFIVQGYENLRHWKNGPPKNSVSPEPPSFKRCWDIGPTDQTGLRSTVWPQGWANKE